MKKIILFLALLLIPFSRTTKNLSLIQPSPVLADQETVEEERERDAWEEFWYNFGKIFSDIFTTIGSWFAKDTSVSVEKQENKDDQKFTEYNARNKDVTNRARTQSSQRFNKGTYLKGIIDDIYSDDRIAYICDGLCSDEEIYDCTEIHYSHLVFYFYQKNRKILYDKDTKKIVDYDSSKMEDYDYQIPINDHFDQCFDNLYHNMPSVPQGKVQNSDEDVAAVSSNELNDNLRTPIPASSQGEKPSTGDEDDDLVAKANDNKEKQDQLFKNFIPNKSQGQVAGADSDQVLGSSSETYQYKKTFTNYLHPKSWQDSTSTSEYLPDRGLHEDCNARGSHCRGMSQYGAFGLSRAGKDYKEILKFYYGSNTTIKTIDTSNVKIKLTGWDHSFSFETYLKGLGEMPDYWGKDSKQGFQALKAQVVAARTYAYMRTQKFTKAICTSSRCQVFDYKKINSTPNLSRAVDETEGEILIDSTNLTAFTTEYARSFCGPSKQVVYDNHTIESVNGIKYEQEGLKATNREPDAYCK